MTTRKNKLTALKLNMLSLRSRARTRPVSLKGFLESLREYYLRIVFHMFWAAFLHIPQNIFLSGNVHLKTPQICAHASCTLSSSSLSSLFLARAFVSRVVPPPKTLPSRRLCSGDDDDICWKKNQRHRTHASIFTGRCLYHRKKAKKRKKKERKKLRSLKMNGAARKRKRSRTCSSWSKSMGR